MPAFATKPRISKAQFQATDPRPEVFQILEESVKAIQNSEDFRRYLAFQARFHTYSWNNVCLIMRQRSNATQVMGYAKWQETGRQVAKGEHGIKILAPRFRKDEVDGDPKLTGFFVVRVFDVSQTVGDPLPDVSCPVLGGDEGKDLFDLLQREAVGEGLRVEISADLPDDVMGDYSPKEKRIRVRPNPMQQMVKTLAHELGHHFHLSRFGEESATRDERETIAESAAYVVCAAHGVDTGERSFSYIATWAGEKDLLKKAMATIQKVSAAILKGIEPA